MESVELISECCWMSLFFRTGHNQVWNHWNWFLSVVGCHYLTRRVDSRYKCSSFVVCCQRGTIIVGNVSLSSNELSNRIQNIRNFSSSSHIDHLQSDVFKGLKKLDHLELKNNDLLEMENNFLVSLKSVKKIDLTQNKLTFLHPATIKQLDSMQLWIFPNASKTVSNEHIRWLLTPQQRWQKYSTLARLNWLERIAIFGHATLQRLFQKKVPLVLFFQCIIIIISYLRSIVL